MCKHSYKAIADWTVLMKMRGFLGLGHSANDDL
jgi:hypothetical protein